ncbi:hypothetical protein [Tractidigestivibacter scatoligenes]|jgi:hypothetical protein|uniref:hypothetical protein n=1 Tax=Tractidigestivibacter scatoligenes TaxID=1299998 RepID=UPI002F35A4F0
MPNIAAFTQADTYMGGPLRDANASENLLDQGQGLFSAACARLGLDASAAETDGATCSSDAELLEKELLALVGADDA